VNDLPTLIASGGFGTGVLTAFGLLLRSMLMKDKILTEHMKEMLEATKASARADYAVAAALGRIEQKLGLSPSGAGSPPAPSPSPAPTPAPSSGGQV